MEKKRETKKRKGREGKGKGGKWLSGKYERGERGEEEDCFPAGTNYRRERHPLDPRFLAGRGEIYRFAGHHTVIAQEINISHGTSTQQPWLDPTQPLPRNTQHAFRDHIRIYSPLSRLHFFGRQNRIGRLDKLQPGILNHWELDPLKIRHKLVQKLYNRKPQPYLRRR